MTAAEAAEAEGCRGWQRLVEAEGSGGGGRRR